MHPLYDEFISYLDAQNKEKGVIFVLSNLSDGQIDIPTLYNEILTPALNEATCKLEQRELCIWEEHLRTSIVRTIIEICYPYVIRARNERVGTSLKGKVIVVCPPEESRMVSGRARDGTATGRSLLPTAAVSAINR